MRVFDVARTEEYAAEARLLQPTSVGREVHASTALLTERAAKIAMQVRVLGKHQRGAQADVVEIEGLLGERPPHRLADPLGDLLHAGPREQPDPELHYAAVGHDIDRAPTRDRSHVERHERNFGKVLAVRRALRLELQSQIAQRGDGAPGRLDSVPADV